MKYFVLLLIIFLSGCAGFDQFIDALERREGLSSCVRYEGFMRAGRSIFAGQVMVKGATVTGGAVLADCLGQQEIGE